MTHYEKVEQLVKMRGISFYRLAKEIGIPTSIFSDLKSGRNKTLSFERICKIANYFGIDPTYFSDESNPIREAKMAVNLTEKPVETQKKDSPEKEPSEFETLYAKLTEEQKGMVIAMMRMLVAGNKG